MANNFELWLINKITADNLDLRLINQKYGQ